MSEFGHISGAFKHGRIDAWGVGPFELTVAGKLYRFEDSDRFGPFFLRKDGEPKSNQQMSERSPFWRTHSLWIEQGRKVAEDRITCMVDIPPLRPTKWKRVGRMRVIVEGGDDRGGFIEVES